MDRPTGVLRRAIARWILDRLSGPLGRGLAVGLLLMLLASMALQSMRQKSVTVDEIMYIAAGHYHLETGDFSLNATNTPLMKLVAAAPLLVLDPELPAVESDLADWSLVEQWQYSRSFLYDNTINAERLLAHARLPIVLLTMLLGLGVYWWAAELYGTRAGLVALLLFCFSPNILAHGRLATHDLGLTAFMFASTYFFWRYLRQPGVWTLVLTGLFAGLALLAKTTAVFLAPIFGLYGLACVLRRNGRGIDERLPGVASIVDARLRQLVSGSIALGVIGAVVLLVLNAGYGFQGSRLQIPLPGPFLDMIGAQADLVAGGTSVYFAGADYPGGAWFIMPLSILIKTPIPLLLLLAAAVAGMVLRARQPDLSRAPESAKDHDGLDHAADGTLRQQQVATFDDELLPIIFVGVMVFAFSFVIQTNAGLRYVLPIYPFLHVLAAGAVASPWATRLTGRARQAGIAAAVVLGLWYVGTSVAVHPHYLAYFNGFVGGPNSGYRYLVDSSLDWGQDLEGLREYMTEQDIARVRLGYFGSADASYHGIDYEYLPSVGLTPLREGQQWWYEMTDPAPEIVPEPGVYAISATLRASPGWLRGRFHTAYTWFREHEPDDQVGHSILIYHVN